MNQIPLYMENVINMLDSPEICDYNCETCKYNYKIKGNHVFKDKYHKEIENFGFSFDFEEGCHLVNVIRYAKWIKNL